MSPQLFSQKVTARAACLAWLSAVSVGGQGPAAVDPSDHALPRRPVRTKGRHRDGRGGKCSLEGGCWHTVEWRGISCFPAGPAPLPRGVHPRLPGARGTGRDGTGWGAGPWPGRSPGALLAGAPALHGRDAGRVGRVPARRLLARGRGPGSGLGCGARPGPPLLLLLVGASGRKARLAKGAGGPEAGLPAGPLPPPTRRPPGDPDPGHARSDRVLSCSALTSAPPLRDP